MKHHPSMPPTSVPNARMVQASMETSPARSWIGPMNVEWKGWAHQGARFLKNADSNLIATSNGGTVAGTVIAYQLSAFIAVTQRKGLDELAEVITTKTEYAKFARLCNMIHKMERLPRSHATNESIVSQLCQETKLPLQDVQQVQMLLQQSSNQPRITSPAEPNLPRTVEVKWKINVVMSTRYLKKALQAFVEMTFTLSTGQVRTIEMNLAKFHQLRYNIALLLKRIQTAESKQIMQRVV